MPKATNLVLTRKEKKPEARKAVLFAMQIATNCIVKVEGEEADLSKKVLGIIEHYSLSAYPLDIRDVTLALWSLHDRGEVLVGHFGVQYEREHAVKLLKA